MGYNDGYDDRYDEEEETVEITYDRHEQEGDKAHSFLIDEKLHWIPKSQMKEWDPNRRTFNIPEWLAIEEELC